MVFGSFIKKSLNSLIFIAFFSQAYANESPPMIEFAPPARGATQPLQAVKVKILPTLEPHTVEIQVTDPVFKAMAVWSMRLSAPQIVSASAGVIVGQYQCFDLSPVNCSIKGLLFQAEPGLGGGKASVGLAYLGFVNLGNSNVGLLELPVVGVDLKASILQTWGPFRSDSPTYFGAEADFEILLVKLTIGLLKRVSPQARSLQINLADDWIITTGIGIGF